MTAAAALLVALVAYRAAAALPLDGALDRALAASVVATAQIVAVMLVAGVVLEDLRPGVVLALHAALAAGALAMTRRAPWPRPSVAGPRRAWAAARAHPWAGALVAAAAAVLAWRLVVAYAFPPTAWDSLAYHLTAVAGWLQAERIGANGLHVLADSYPLNGELLAAWVALLRGDDTWVDAVQLPFAVVGALAVAGFARLAGARPPAMTAAGALFVLAPIVQLQATSSYVDLFVAAMFLAALYLAARGARTGSPAYVALAGVAAGVALGGKPTGALLAAGTGLGLLAGLLLARRAGRLPAARAGSAVAVFAVAVAGFGGYWYARNFVEHGNPIHPGHVEIAGLTLLDGPGVVLTTPPGGSQLRGLVHSWGHDVTRLWQGRPESYHREDELSGGLGLVWLLLGLPLLAPFAWSLARRRDPLVWTFLVPIALVFALQPYRWWSRFTIALLAPALVALVVFLERSGSRRLRVGIQSLTLLFVAVAIWLGSTHVYRWGRDRDALDVVRLAAGPGDERTVGALFLPAFRWVDELPADARIAAAIPVIVSREPCPDGVCRHHPFFYGLYGRRFEHRVTPLRARSPRAMAARLRRDRIGYAFVDRGSRYARWLRREPGYRLLYRDWRVEAWATPWAASSR